MSRTMRNAATAAFRIVVTGLGLGVIALLLGPITGQYRTLTVLTGSMAPALDPGTVVISVPVDAKSIRPGHVITFEDGETGDLTTHRVAAVEREAAGDFAVTKGDANNAVDAARVELAGAVWRQRAQVPYVGHVLVGLQGHPLTRHLGLVFAGLLAIIWLVRIWAPRPQATTAPEAENVAA